MLPRNLIRQIKQESQRIQDEERGIGGQKEREMIALWRQIRPRMVARLEQAGILDEFAHLLINRASEASMENQRAGMGWPDSREEANKDWLLMDPEEPDEPTNSLELMLETAARAQVPRSVRVQAQQIRKARAAVQSLPESQSENRPASQAENPAPNQSQTKHPVKPMR